MFWRLSLTDRPMMAADPVEHANSLWPLWALWQKPLRVLSAFKLGFSDESMEEMYQQHMIQQSMPI